MVPVVVSLFWMLTASPEWSLTSRYQMLVSTAAAGEAEKTVRPAAAQTVTATRRASAPAGAQGWSGSAQGGTP